MQYFIYPFILLAYFELLGRWIMLKLKREPFEFSFVIGFVAVMTFMYLFTWPITALNQSFYMLLGVCAIAFLVSLGLMLKDIKKISYEIDFKYWLLLGVLFAFGMLVSWNRTLGETHGFDTLYYLNMIGFNIGNPEMNTLHPHFGTYPNNDIQWITYVFQSFYYFVPVVIYAFRQALGIIGVSFETLPAYVWGFQILCHSIFIASSLMCVKELNCKNKWLNLAFVILLVLFLNNLYYNNVYGFIGNNYRMSIHAIATIVLFRYFKNPNKTDLLLFIGIMLGMCGVSSTGTFATVFVLFGLFFVVYKSEKDILKYYAIALYVPLVNILVTKIGMSWYLLLGVLIFCALVYVLNDYILKLYQNKYIRYGTLVLVALIFIVASGIMSKKILDIKLFFNNYSEIADMSWDYFMFDDLRHWIFNPIVLIPYIYFLIKNPKHPFSIICIVLMITFFNPFGSRFMNTINWVYYRAYDIIINQYTLIFFIYYMYKTIDYKYLKNMIAIFVLTGSIVLSIIQIPRYYHESFEVYDDYNPIYKISNSEVEVIYNVRNMVNDLEIDKPKIITPTFFMPTFIEDSTYLIGKEKRYDYSKYEDLTFNLYLIFFPVDGIYDFFRPEQNPDYQNTIKYLDECDYDILVVDNSNYYYDEIEQTHKPITELIETDGRYQKTVYSTAKYAVYYLGE